MDRKEVKKEIERIKGKNNKNENERKEDGTEKIKKERKLE